MNVVLQDITDYAWILFPILLGILICFGIKSMIYSLKTDKLICPWCLHPAGNHEFVHCDLNETKIETKNDGFLGKMNRRCLCQWDKERIILNAQGVKKGTIESVKAADPEARMGPWR